jgi:hypothetical protein
MNGTLSGLVGSLQAAAQAAEENEKRFRASLRPRLEALERERVFAFRRLNLVVDMARKAARQDAFDTAAAAVIAFVAAEFALERGRDRHETILSRLSSVAEAVALTTHPAPDEDAVVPDVAAALATFEAWYRTETGAYFLARADIAVPETPLTDW